MKYVANGIISQTVIVEADTQDEPAHEEFTAERIAQAADEIERLRKQLVKASERIGDAELALAFWDEGRNSEYWLRWPAIDLIAGMYDVGEDKIEIEMIKEI